MREDKPEYDSSIVCRLGVELVAVIKISCNF